MNDQITCPYCKKSFPVTEALRHQIKEDVSREFEREQKQIMWKKALAAAEGRTKEKSLEEMKMLKEELEEKDKKLQESRNNELQIRKERIKLEEEKKELEIKTQRKMDEERQKIATESYKKAIEDNRLKNLEHEKKEADLLKQIEELKQKAQQGSQQLQGEVLELELEKMLKREFPYDEINEVPKGVKGADVLQIVKNNTGKTCGTIIWESKRTKLWTEGWIVKLKEDQRRLKVETAIIITQVLPNGVKNFTQRDGVWIGNFESFIGLGLLLRNTLIELSSVKSSVVGKHEKKEILWNYLTSIEFRQRLEAMYDAYEQSKINLDKEKEFFRRKWARDDKNVELLMENLLGIHGDLQGIIGRSLPEIKRSDMLPSGHEEKKDKLF
jgi:hypothetical protein